MEQRPSHCRSVFISACLLYLLSLSHTEAFCFRHTYAHTPPLVSCAHLCLAITLHRDLESALNPLPSLMLHFGSAADTSSKVCRRGDV